MGCPGDYDLTTEYDDKVLYDLLQAASKVLKSETNEILESVGYWFVVYLLETVSSTNPLNSNLIQMNFLLTNSKF